MPRLRSSVRDQVRAENRERFMQAAASEFARTGYAGANINRISQSAGFAKGTVYNYFASKRELMSSLIRSIATEHVAAILASANSAANAADRLGCLFREGFSFVEQHPTQARVMISLAYGSDCELKSQVYRAYEPLFQFVKYDIVQAGNGRREWHISDADLATACIMAVYLGSCSELDANNRITLDARDVSRFILDGLRHQRKNGRKGRKPSCK